VQLNSAADLGSKPYPKSLKGLPVNFLDFLLSAFLSLFRPTPPLQDKPFASYATYGILAQLFLARRLLNVLKNLHSSLALVSY
jgi:hypothetical protein